MQVNTDQQDKGLAANLIIDRDTASRLGVAAADIDSVLYDAFGQRQVSTMYEPLNQYHVVMEVAPQFQQSPDTLENTYVHSSTGATVPLSAFTHYGPANTSLAVNHQGQWPAVTISFNLAPGVSLGQATTAIENAKKSIGFPATIHASFQGTAAAFKDSLSSEPILILTAVLTVYIVLGILYESYIHPITILSTIPSAGVGALLALKLTHNELNVIGLIGIILLIGLVKKNAIMMIDFALEAERNGRQIAAGCDSRSLPAAFSSHHDDHDGGAAGRAAAGAGDRDRIGIAAAAGHYDCRWIDCQPGADVVHHAGGVSVHGQIAAVAKPHRRPVETGVRRRRATRTRTGFFACVTR